MMLADTLWDLCSGRLFVSVTSLKDRKNVIISEFDSKEELIQVGTKLFIAPKSVANQNQTNIYYL